jgi:aminopeptidase N
MHTVLSLLLILAVTPPAGQPPALSADHIDSSHKARLTVSPLVRALSPPADPLAAATDVLHYRLDLQIDPSSHRLTGANEITVRCVAAVATFRFRLDDLFTIGAVTVDGQSASWQRLDTETIEVTLDRARGSGETFVLLIPYDGFPTSAYGSLVFTTHSGQPIVYTLSEPWFAYT